MAQTRVPPEAAGQRVDHALADALPALGVAGARRLLAAGRVRVDGRRARKGDKLAAGQAMDVDDAALAAETARHDATPVRPDPGLALAVLYADDTLVAVAKPAGVPSHPLRPGELGTAANAICARFPGCATASPDAREGGLVQRLDTGTSGVLIAARTPDAWAPLHAALTAEDCEKTYLAEVTGTPPGGGVEEAAIGRVGRRGARVRVGGGRRPLDARTVWHLVEQREATALVRAHLHAGRTHQVRAHLAAAGHPVVGDEHYGSGGQALRLHAAAVRFRHPISGQAILIEAPPPDWAMIRG
jgi:23S rRNA pseudouridine1911/1915/1917 synthase